MLDEAWMIHFQNLNQDKTDSGKKSHAESGSAALSILILIIKLEADLRSRYDYKTQRSDADSSLNPVKLMTELAAMVNDKLDSTMLEKYKIYLGELLLVRNIIAHGYLYEGEIFFDDEWSVTKIEGSNVTGRDRGKLDEEGRTILLKVETSPYKLCVFDSITVYRAIEAVREMTELHVLSERILHKGEYIEMTDWLNLAIDGMTEERKNILDSLTSDYYEIMGAGWDLEPEQ